jgi:hypothetical protein
MSARTYIYGLYLVLNAAQRYGTRWQKNLQGSMTSQQYQCFQAVLNAIAECLPLILPGAPAP